MGFLKPDIEARQPKSQATPLSQDLLNLMRQNIAGGDFGMGLTKTQQDTTRGLQDFIGERQNIDAFTTLMGPLAKMFNRQTDKDVADVREGFSALGGRFSTPLMREESTLRGNRANDLDALIADLFLKEQNSLLSALSLLGQQGMSNIAPALTFGGMGILPEDTIVNESPWMTLFKTAGQIAASAAAPSAK